MVRGEATGPGQSGLGAYCGHSPNPGLQVWRGHVWEPRQGETARPPDSTVVKAKGGAGRALTPTPDLEGRVVRRGASTVKTRSQPGPKDAKVP